MKRFLACLASAVAGSVLGSSAIAIAQVADTQTANQPAATPASVVAQPAEPKQGPSYPNLYIRLSSELVGAGIRGYVDETGPLRDCILGTSVTGTARTTARTDVRLLPSRNSAKLNITFSGLANSNTVGRNGPATIYSRGATNLWGQKQAIFDESGFRTLPAMSDAKTRTTITGVGVNRGGLIGGVIQNIATKQVYQNKSQAEAIASSRAEGRLNQRLNEEVGKTIARANSDYQKEFVTRLRERDAYPAQLRFNTTSNYLTVRALQASNGQAGAPTGPIRLDADTDLGVFVHESMIRNIAESMFAGKTLTDDDLRERALDWTGSIPEELKLNPEEEPWSITFADEDPITAQFSRGQVEITIRGDEFTSGDRRFPAMNITAVYRLDGSGPVLRAVREGELQIFPPNFDPNGDQSLSIRQQSLRRLLERRFGRIFQEEIVGEGLKLPGRWRQAGELNLAAAEARSEWLGVAWSKPARPTPVRAVTKAAPAARLSAGR